MKNNATKDLTSGNLYRNFILFAIPLVLSSLLSQAFGTIDTIIAGRCIGENALAATSAASTFHSLFNSFFWGFGTGLGVYVAHLFGAGRFRELRSTIYSVYLLYGGVILCASGVVLLLRVPLFHYLKVDPEIWDDAMTYFVIVVCAKLLTLSTNLGVYLLNGLGNTVFPFWMSLLSAVLNLTGNIVTVVVFGWGVAGLAYSTVFAALVVALSYAIVIPRCISKMQEREKDAEPFRFDLTAVRHALRYSAPVSLQQMVMYVCTFGLAPLINGLGVAATAGYAIASKAYNICSSFYMSSSRTVSNYVAQCVGAGKLGSISKGMRVGFLQGTLFVSLPLLLFVCFPAQSCGLFFSSDYEGEALQLAVAFCRWYLPFILFAMLNNQFHAFFRGFAAMKMLIIGTAVGAVSRLVLSYILFNGADLDGIYLAWVLSWIIEAFFSMVVYLAAYRNERQLRERHIAI